MRVTRVVFAALALLAIAGCSDEGPVPTRPWSGLIRYEFVAAWGDSGSGDGQFQYPRAVAVDRSGRVYVLDASRVQRFTANGAFLDQWGGYGTGDGQFAIPSGVAVDPAGNVYVAEGGNCRIQKFDADGTYLAQWGGPGTGDGQFSQHYSSLGIAVDASGHVYVADTGNHRIQKFGSDGAYLGQWGSLGTGPGAFSGPRGVGVDGEGRVSVADGHSGIQKFTGDGVFLGQWAMRDERFHAPERLAVGERGTVFVTDYYERCIKVYGSAGSYLTRWEFGSAGDWQWLRGLAVDGDGNVYVTDNGNHRVLKFAPRR